MWNIAGNNLVSVVQCSMLRLYALFTFEKGKIKISSASLLYCHGPLVLSAKKGFSAQKLSNGAWKKCLL